MSKEVKKLLPILKVIAVLPQKLRQKLLNGVDDDFVRVVAEICFNFCRGNVKCDKKSYEKLKKYKCQIHSLAKTRKVQKSYRKEKKVICQKGGSFLTLLLPPVITALTQHFLER